MADENDCYIVSTKKPRLDYESDSNSRSSTAVAKQLKITEMFQSGNNKKPKIG